MRRRYDVVAKVSPVEDPRRAVAAAVLQTLGRISIDVRNEIADAIGAATVPAAQHIPLQETVAWPEGFVELAADLGVPPEILARGAAEQGLTPQELLRQTTRR